MKRVVAWHTKIRGSVLRKAVQQTGVKFELYIPTLTDVSYHTEVFINVSIQFWGNKLVLHIPCVGKCVT
jgi:hypothetical protein